MWVWVTGTIVVNNFFVKNCNLFYRNYFGQQFVVGQITTFSVQNILTKITQFWGKQFFGKTVFTTILSNSVDFLHTIQLPIFVGSIAGPVNEHCETQVSVLILKLKLGAKLWMFATALFCCSALNSHSNGNGNSNNTLHNQQRESGQGIF